MITYSLPIVAIKQETEDTITLSFKQPGLKKIRYQAGQYLTLIFRVNGRRYSRPYSFSSTFGIDATIDVTVKRVVGGMVSNHIIDTLNVGDSVEVLPPLGDFVLSDTQRQNINHIILWGVGSGITPLFSIIKDNIKNSNLHITLVYGNRQASSVIFAKELEILKNLHPDRFTLLHFHTQPILDSTNTHIFAGRINPANALVLIEKIKPLTSSLHYICGPLGLKESVKQVLENAGLKKECIFSEDFEIVKKPEDFIDIHTHSIFLKKDDAQHLIEVVKGKSILEAGLDLGLELDYACQTGNCSVCKGRVIQGAVRTIGIDRIREDLGPEEYLLCCTYPVSDDVIVEV